MIEQHTKEFWKTTIALSIGSLLIFANVYFTQPILPVLAEDFGVSTLTANLTVSLLILALGIALFFFGPISDSYGRRGIMITTMTLSIVLTFVAAFAPSFDLLLVTRIVQGICLAGLPSLAVAYIGEEYAKQAISVAIGIYISGNTIGGMFGRIFSGMVTELYGWRIAFLAMGIISVLLLIAFIFLLSPSKQFTPKPLRLKGSLREYKSHLTNKELMAAYFVGGLHFLIFVGHFSYITFLLSGAPYFLSPSIIGILFLTYLAGTFSSPLSGKLATKLSRATCIKIGIVIMVVGFLLTLQGSVIAIIFGLLLTCFGFFFAHSAASSWVSSRAKTSKASASGLYLIFYYIGGSLGAFYLEPFWSYAGWSGIVVASLFILGVTTVISFKMRTIEVAEEQGNEVRGIV